jgi:hypothetical protein
MEQIEVGNKTI